MLNPAGYPDWVQFVRLILTLAVTISLGIHAFYQHKKETIDTVSPRKWMYWLYSIVFLLAAVGNFMQMLITINFQSYSKASFHLGYSTLLLTLSYLAILVGVARKTY